MADHLARFVRQSLQAGQSRDAIARALSDAGWSGAEIRDALDDWGDSAAGLPPVPRPRATVSARDAVIYGLLFVSLVILSWHIVQLGFGVIESLLPYLDDSMPPVGRMRWAIAALLAFLPVFVLLDRRVARASGADPGQRRSLVRRWFASAALLISALVLLGDLVATLYAALTGDMTLRFALKALLVAVMGGLVLAYYRGDLDG